eukprot:12928110-Prorocentrum_lima.AAC.1
MGVWRRLRLCVLRGSEWRWTRPITYRLVKVASFQSSVAFRFESLGGHDASDARDRAGPVGNCGRKRATAAAFRESRSE